MFKKSSLAFRIVVAGLLLFVCWIFLAWYLAERLIVRKQLEKADAIVVLGGSSTYIERTQLAAQLIKGNVTHKIFLTDDGERAGWSQAEQKNPAYVELAKRELIAQGVAPEAIEIMTPRGSGTIYEAETVEALVRSREYKSLLLVTSAYHSRRALNTFNNVFTQKGLDVELGVEPAALGQQTPPPFIWWLSRAGWDYVAGEYVKSFYYWTFI